MKLRIKSNSIRYRLTKTDIAQLLKEGTVKEKVSFGDDDLVYMLQSFNDQQLSADFKNNIITLYIPIGMLDELANTDRIGMENRHGNLHLLVEKDFVCLDTVAEDQSDNYPNPLAIKPHEQN